MAIDPRLYEKLSGRKGDPHDRLGAVLAEDAKLHGHKDRFKGKKVRRGVSTSKAEAHAAVRFFTRLFSWF